MIEYGTASLPEIVWSVTSLTGLVYNLWALRDTLQDQAYLEAQGANGLHQITAAANVRNEAKRCLIQFTFLAIGLVAMGAQAGTRSGDPSPTTYFATVGFIFVNVLMVIVSRADRRDRHRMLNIAHQRRLEREEQEEFAGG